MCNRGRMADLSLMTWPQVETYLESSTAIVVPIGSTEQHGPAGLIGTDHICAEVIARGVGERTGVLVAPAIPVGMALHHMAFTGTISLSPETLERVIGDYVRSLYQHGFRVIVFLNGHGGNIKTGAKALRELQQELDDVTFLWINWWQPDAVKTLVRELIGDRDGQHGTPSELSVTMAAHPGLLDVPTEPMDISAIPYKGIPDAVAYRRLYPDGHIAADQSLASEDKGVVILECAIAAISDSIRELS